MFDERWGYVDIDLNIFPHSCHKNHPWSFFENALAAANQWTIETVMPPTFSVKWYAGMSIINHLDDFNLLSTNTIFSHL